MVDHSSGRREALKARHRAAILAAARSLIDERDGAPFSVDELAERADVARRTVFNHFASLDDVLLTLGTEVISVLVADFLAEVAAAPVGAGSRASMFDELARLFRAADLAPAVVSVTKILGGRHDMDDPRKFMLTHTAFRRVAGALAPEVTRRYAGANPLDVELLVHSLMSGITVIAGRWIELTGATLDDASRAVWDELLTRLLDNIRNGYLPT
ncbi:TetR/AcrR family transcriptional regulator [Dactylosporangium sp. CS-033363]|uniref:TetR/AcrR family transcriptional regulator n=1 Tax=Dactylosporangium sp. CS-033363 TaxID=3239935 RepID=UPI003D949477